MPQFHREKRVYVSDGAIVPRGTIQDLAMNSKDDAQADVIREPLTVREASDPFNESRFILNDSLTNSSFVSGWDQRTIQTRPHQFRA